MPSKNPSRERRGYHQRCGLAKALDIVGERWTLLLVRDLLLGPRRYSELLEHHPGLTTNLLAQRLREMEAVGLVERVRLTGPAKVPAYRLTARGHALEPAIHALASWGGDVGTFEPDDRFDPGWMLLSWKRLYRPVARRFVVRLAIDGRVFTLVLDPDRLEVAEQDPPIADLDLRGAGFALGTMAYRGVAARILEERGELSYDGPPELFLAFLRAFGMTAGGRVTT